MMADGNQNRRLCRVVDRVRLEVFEVDTETWSPPIPLSDAIEARNSTFLPLSSHSILCIGGYDSKYSAFLRDAFLISPQGVVQLLPALAFARCGIGLIEKDGRIWAFGGRDVKVTTMVERMSLEGGEWELGREMTTARAYFNPVECQGEAYLCGGLTAACECFSFANETYRLLNYQLPEASEALTLLFPDRLVILTGRHITQVEGNEGEVRREDKRVDCVKAACGPVVVGEKVYVVCEGEAWKVDLVTREVGMIGSSRH